MPKHLLIVESPAKAKTIEKYLGKDFAVKSSYGHVRDLEKGDNAVDIDNDFAPKYIVSPEKKKVVKELKDWVKKVDEVWLATDEDREGEAISWHLCQVLGLDEAITKRIVFREITKPAIQNAIQQPRTVDIDLVNAQQTRRILDRLVGYKLSAVLWRKIKSGLSAGRVQSVALKLVVEREREINQFNTTPFYRIAAIFTVKNEQGKSVALKAEAPQRFDAEKDAETFLQNCIGATFKIDNIEVRPLKRRPAAPFTTSTLQQEASRKLGFSVSRTMSVAQRLYEAGHITYMRTDSTNLSSTAVQTIAQEIEKQYGKQYVQTRNYKNKVANAQEAHEAIRPTYIDRHSITSDRDEQRLYELIWKRTIASQMADAQLEKTVVKIGISTMPAEHLAAEGEVLKFDGFLKVYLESKDDDEEEETKGMLPPLKKGQVLPLQEMTATERFTRPPARFTEASLVKRLEELGIGRPSTYAPIISKIMEEARGYVVKETREGVERKYRVLTLSHNEIKKKMDTELTGAVSNRLFPTDMGITVSDFLDEHFKEVMNYQFTAEIEKQFDEISNGKQQWTSILKDFYQPFNATVKSTMENADRPSRERILGKDPASGHTVLTRMTRNGAVVQIGTPEELPEDAKPRYANLQPGQSIDTITYEEAMKLFELPRTLEPYQGEEVAIGTGRYGPYVKFGEKFISIPRHEDPLALSRERAIELIVQKLREDAPVGTYKGEPITKGKGRFGPFLKWKDYFVNVPKKYDFERISLEDMHTLIEAKVNKEANRYIKRWEAEKIDLENGRWGPFIRFGKEMISLPKKDGQRVSAEEAAEMTIEEVKALIVEKIPDAFEPKKKTTKKAPAKKTTKKKK
ncbi:MAG TPA: type I DNA topoisomerase [Saprospiraceae bacterium]|nr:type I DNA topoisomerase [Saprospiraceae bacterium]HMP23131.1 type I DNA topoisomerase [Saprospiraceae bacterium]